MTPSHEYRHAHQDNMVFSSTQWMQSGINVRDWALPVTERHDTPPRQCTGLNNEIIIARSDAVTGHNLHRLQATAHSKEKSSNRPGLFRGATGSYAAC